MQDKVWFIRINQNSEGPFSIDDLKKDPRIHPDLQVWREGFDHWSAIRYIPELMWALWGLEAECEEEEAIPQDELAIEVTPDPRTLFLFLLLSVLALSYLLYLFWNG